MTGRQTVAVSVLVTLALAVALGITIRVYQDGQWWGRLQDAKTAITANQTSFGAARVTGQNPQQLQAQCAAAVADYNRAARHLDLPDLDTAMECTP